MPQTHSPHDLGPTAALPGAAPTDPRSALLDSIDGIVFEFDIASSSFVYVSRAAETLLGYPLADWFQPNFWRDHLHPEDRDEAFNFCVERTLALKDHHLEYRMLARDGRAVWFHDHVTVIANGGTPTCLRGLMIDITERKHVEGVLREIRTATAAYTGEDFFRQLARHLARALQMRWAIVGELVPESQSIRTRAFWAGDRFEPDVDIALAGSACETTMSDGVLAVDRDFQERFGRNADVRRLGATSYVGVPLVSSTREPIGTLSVMHDGPLPTHVDVRSILEIFAARAGAELERQRAEAALRHNENRTRALLSAIPDKIFLLDAAGKFLDFHVPPAMPAFVPVERLVGRSLRDVLAPELAERLHVLLARALGSREIQVERMSIDSQDGARTYEFRTVPCGEDTVLQIVRDVTDERRLEERLAQSQRLEGIGRLAGGIAHDFNNVLTGILGFTEQGELEAPRGGPLADYFTQIRRAGERAAGLTQQLLAFARKQIVEPRVVAIDELVTDVLPFLGRVIGERFEIAPELRSSPWCTRIDPTQFHQVLMNLVVNARDALQAGGRIRITTRKFVLAATQGDTAPGEYVELLVSDTGVGMGDEVLAHVFEPFFTTKDTGRGTGMGLATCYGILRQQGGHISIESRRNEGTRVRVLLPRVEAPVDGSRADRPTSERGREAVLLVEDEGVVRNMLATSLRSLGYTVVEASSGSEALALAGSAQTTFDLLATDVVMPGLSGAKLAGALRIHSPRLTVLFMSGYSPESLANLGMPDGSFGFLRKPFTPSNFTAKVREMLDAASHAR